MTDFVSLHNHTHYSILDAISSPKELFNRAKELGQKAIAITDHGSIGAAWESLKISKDTGVKLIIGCEMYFVDDVSNKEDRFRHIILLAKNAVGYKNLLSLNKAGYDNQAIFAKKVYPLIDWKLLETYAEGLICLTSCGNGILSQLIMQKKLDEAEKQLFKLMSIFGDNLGLEVQANTLKRNANIYNDKIEQVYINSQLIKLAKKHNVRAVATCNSHYVKKEDHEIHDALLAIGSHQPIYSNFRLKYDCPDFYLKSGDEMNAFFKRNYNDYADELCANSVYFADLCEEPVWIDPKHSNPSGKELPIFPVKDEPDYNNYLSWLNSQEEKIKKLPEDQSFLRYRCDLAFHNKVPIGREKEYRDRLEEEFDVLEYRDFSSYMLVVADYVQWAKKQGISSSYGRGSVGGVCVGYMLGIHNADPIKYGLIFARFQNREKLASPDIDIDIATSGRDKVKEYLKQKYGEEHFAHVSNVNTITPKVYVRDIARVCELGGDKDEAVRIGNEAADTILATSKDISYAKSESPLFSEYSKRYPSFDKYSPICGKYRALSSHAGGVIISKRPLVGLVPLRRDKDNLVVLEYEKEKAEENGLVKMDVLGLSTLDIVDETKALIKSQGKEINTIDVEEYDEKTYDLISRGDTFCVFQFGTSAGTIDLCKKVKPKNIEDLATITTLARPASKEIRDKYVARKDGKEKAVFLHPSLQNSLKDTYGFPLYDESLLFLAKDVAGWDLNEADKLRKLTKEKGKNPKKAQQWRSEFIEGALKNNIEEKQAEDIWTKIIEPFGKYSFNKSLYLDEMIDIYDSAGTFIISKPIKYIEVGEFVKSRNEDTKENIFVQVNGKYDHGVLPIVEVELTSGEKVKCTINHKFRVEESGEMLPLWKIIEDDLTIIVDTVVINVEN